MSASRQKKLRQEQNPEVSETKTRQVKEEKKAARQLKIWSAIFYVTIALMVLGLAAGAVWNSGLLQRTFTAATVGEHKLSAAELNHFYVETVNSNYLLPYMVDTTKPLDQQTANNGQNYADMYLETAVQNATSVYAVYDEAMANGFELSEEQEAEITSAIDSMKMYASISGYGTGNAMVRANYGRGCNLKTYENYIRVNQIANYYSQQVGEAMEATDEELAAEIAENGKKYYSYDYRILEIGLEDYYKNMEPDAEGNYTEEQTAAAQEAAMKAAKILASKLRSTPEAFEADEDSILKEGIAYSSIPAILVEWVTDDARQANDVTTAEMASGKGCYIAMYLGTDDNSTTMLTNVRHILIQPEGDAENEDGTYSETQMAEAMEKAQALLEEWQAGDATEESFATLANEHSKDTGSNTNGGLYEDIRPGDMVEEFNDWCFDETRKAGDTGLVQTTYGVHIMYFSSHSDQNYLDAQAEYTILEARFNQWMEALVEAMPNSTDNFGMKLVNRGIYVKAQSSTGY